MTRPIRRRAGGFAWFFTKQVMAFILLAMLVIIVDVVIYFLAGFYASEEYTSEYSPAAMVVAADGSLSRTQDGWELDEEGRGELASGGAWAMLVNDETGAVLWSENLPDDVPRSYRRSDVAVAAHFGAISDYPVAFWQRDDGLLVAGVARQAFWTMRFTWPTESVTGLFGFVALVFLADFSILFLYGLLARRKTRRAVVPIADALDGLARGQAVDLRLRGDLREVGDNITRASDELRRKDAAREQWIRGVSHDIRTPLALIAGNADAIVRDDGVPDAARASAGAIRIQSLRIADLVNDLNAATRLEYDTQPIDLSPVPLAPLVRRVAADNLNGSLPEGFALDVAVADDAAQAQLLGDGRLLTRAVQNLVNNAVAHNPGGCRISLALSCDAQGAIISVSDDGKGVPPDALAALRSRIRAGQADDAGDAGHGLGLVLVAKIAAAHGGSLAIESACGEGFVAEMRYPLPKWPGNVA